MAVDDIHLPFGASCRFSRISANDGEEPSIENLMEMLLEAARLSFVVALWSVLITVPLALVSSTFLYDSRWRSLEIFFLLPLFLPPTVVGFALLWILSPLTSFGSLIRQVFGPLVFTPAGTVLACVLVSFPLAFQACVVGLARVEGVLKESAVMLGGTGVFNTIRVVWPQMQGALMIAILLVFSRVVGEFGASVMVGGNIQGHTQTLPLAIYQNSQNGDWAMAGAAALISVFLGVGAYMALRWVETRSK